MTGSKPTELPGDPSLPGPAEELRKLITDGESVNGKYSVEDFFRTPEKSRYQLSPDGTHFSYLGPFERRCNIFIQKVGEQIATRITAETERDIAGYFWTNNNRLVYVKDKGGDENFTLIGINKNASNILELTPFDNVRIGVIDTLEDDDDAVIIVMNKNDSRLFEPYRLNINTGETRQLAENTDAQKPISEWLTDHDGKLRIAIRLNDGINPTIMYRKTEGEPFSDVITTDFRQTLSPEFFDFDNSSVVYVVSNLGRDKSVAIKFDLETGEEVGEPVFSHPDVDTASLDFSRKRKVLTVSSYVTWKRHYHFFDDETSRIFFRLKEKLPDVEISLADFSKDENKLLIRTYSDRSLGGYHLYDVEADELLKICDVAPWLNPDDLAEMKPIEYKARDGVTIHGYLTMPRSHGTAKPPVVVNPHGGPWARDSWDYDPQSQLLANRGYAVFQMNYRGSVGYGRKFWEMSFKQWGLSMQDDITDGVQWLIDEGHADKDRIAIYGGSYGGYATLAGITKTPKLYACAVDYVGVSNLFTFMETIPAYWQPYLKRLYEMIGHPERDDVRLAENSPAFHVDNIRCPLFVVQGANDPRVNIDESDQIVKSLRNRGIDVPYMVKYDEGHGFQNEENRFEFYKALLGFLGKHLA
jgi:dipeptidyl aminopeptidase/acylaminoacyl peptidase